MSADVFMRLIDALSVLRCHDWTMPSQRVRIFLMIAAKPGMTATELKLALKADGDLISDTSVTRNIAALCCEHGAGRKVVSDALVAKVVDNEDTIKLCLFLTNSGRLVAREIITTISSPTQADKWSVVTAKEAAQGRR